jgi:hypothetical protein
VGVVDPWNFSVLWVPTSSHSSFKNLSSVIYCPQVLKTYKRCSRVSRFFFGCRRVYSGGNTAWLGTWLPWCCERFIGWWHRISENIASSTTIENFTEAGKND